MDLNAARIFVSVVQLGGFSRAAKQLQMPLSTVSAKVAQLETELKVSLLRRSTRTLNLTESGQVFFDHAVKALNEFTQGEQRTRESNGKIQGRIRMTAPVEIGVSTLADALSEFSARYPDLRLELILTDRMVDLIAEGVDLALRMGPLKDSSLVSKRLGLSESAAYASPGYLKKAPPLKRPQDLEQHACLNFTNQNPDQIWTLMRGSSEVSVPVKGPFAANNLLAVHRLTLAHRGVALLPVFLCQEDVQTKRLVQVLEGWSTKPAPVHLVYPSQSGLPKATRLLIDDLAKSLKELF